MFTKTNPDGYIEPIKGICYKTLVHGNRTLLAEFLLTQNHKLPRHSHPHEQTGYLVDGHIVLTIGSESFDVWPGDSWCIPGNTEHEAFVMEDSTAIEVFSPVREDYLPKLVEPRRIELPTS
ncbi:MAG: cupin domain-containing protein [Opitutales bacterium]|nr:cupin domain-containing protein [Opitutales bacterium]